MNIQTTSSAITAQADSYSAPVGRIVSVTGSKAIVLLDHETLYSSKGKERPDMGTLLAIDTDNTVVLAIVSALSVPVPSQRDGDPEVWIAELGMVGELWKDSEGNPASFNRGVTVYPGLGDLCRVAAKHELQMAFCGDSQGSVRVGCIRQDTSIPAMIRVDDLLGKHFAILGTTGTGKSCTTALILRSVLNANPAAHIVLLDPHNEYSTAFKEWGEVLNPNNMDLPYWLLNFEELVQVLLGEEPAKHELETLQELIPLAKARYHSGRGGEQSRLRKTTGEVREYTVDMPVPYRISDLMTLIDERMGKLENKKDLAPYRNLRTRIDTIVQDPRYKFMFGSLTVNDNMAEVLGRIFRVPVNNKPITILELTGIPSEIVNVVVSVLCRMTFDFALWGAGRVPVTIVCEEAHRYVPADSKQGFEPCKRAIAKIAKEGRKYGASLCIVTQRPAEIDATILSQCNTVFALRMSNDKDQAIVQSAVSDTGSGLLEFLPALGQREAIAFGDGVSLPVRIKFDNLAKDNLPRSSTAKFTECWQESIGDEQFLATIVERWRSSGLESGQQPHGQDIAQAPAPAPQAAQPAPIASKMAPQPPAQRQVQPAGTMGREGTPPVGQDPYAAQPNFPTNSGNNPAAASLQRAQAPQPAPQKAAAGAAPPPVPPAAPSLRKQSALRKSEPATPSAGDEKATEAASALRSLRERLRKGS